MRDIQNVSFEEIGGVIEANSRFMIVSHRRPDGDAIGSMVALGNSLGEGGKEVVMVNEDGVPDRLRFLPLVDQVMKVDEIPRDFAPEVVFILDSADLNRVGTAILEWLGEDRFVINIDHHVSNPGFGNMCFVDAESPATGQIIYELIRHLGLPLTPGAMKNLWAAISTDTGSFQYPNTTARTYEIGAELVAAGVNVGEISQQLYESYPYRRIELLRELLNVLKLTAEGRVASWVLTRSVVEKYGIGPDDAEGLIDVIRAIKGVAVAVFFEELKGGEVKISCRSKTPEADVSRMCGKFNGGGHRLAAGARVAGPVDEVERKFLQTVYDDLEGKY